MNPQGGALVPQSMSSSLLTLRRQLQEERARIERAMKSPETVDLDAKLPPSTPKKSSATGSASRSPAPTTPESDSELMRKGRLAMEFKLDIKRDVVEETGRKYDAKSRPAGWFVCARSSDAMLSSKGHLTAIRQFAASRSLSIVVKASNSPVSVIPVSQVSRLPLPTSPRSPLTASKLASTSLQTLPPKSSQLLQHVHSLKTTPHSMAGNLDRPTHSHITPTVTTGTSPFSTASKNDSPRDKPSSDGDTESDEDWAKYSDDEGGGTGTPPFILSPMTSSI